MGTLWQDVRFGLRMFRKSPGFSAIAVLTLALGIGANSAVFSIAHAVLFRPLPYTNSERFVSVSSKTGMFPDMTLNLSWPAFEAVRRQVTSLEQSAGYWEQWKALTGHGDPQLLQVAAVSDEFFEEFGARPRLGRLLADVDREERNGKVVVLSESLWRTRFEADPDIVGRTITLDREPHTVVGVAANGFAFPEKTEAWTPLALEAQAKVNATFYALTFVGKLNPGADWNRLNAELKLVSAQLEKEFPKLKDGYELVATKLIDVEVGESRLGFYVLLGAATLVLLIACTNLTSMLLARGWARHREMAVRAALGASRRRVFQQVIVESCVLGIIGGAAGVALAALAVKLFAAVAPADTPRLAEIRPDWAMVVFALASALATGVLFGVAPARHAVVSLLQKTLQETGARTAGRNAGQSRTGGFWVAGEIALAFVLLIGAGLMLRTLANLIDQDPGFRTENLLSLDLYRPVLQGEEERKKDAPAQAEQIKDIVERVGGLPGVKAAAAANYGLLDGTILVHGGLHVEGLTSIDRDAGFAVRARYVSPTYFTGLGQALLRGRPFSDTDRIGSPSVAIVNAKMARTYWGTLDVLGKRFSSSTDEKGQESWCEIVGVVADVREFLVRDEAVPEYYLPLYQGGVRGASLLVRTAGKPEASVDMVTKQIWSSYPNLPVTNVTSISTTIDKSVGSEKLHTILLGMFAGTGLLMALVGTYGVIAYAVERRRQEIGIRIALGASREHVLFLVFKHVLLPVFAGVAVGIPAALVAERAITSELYGVEATDPATFGLAALSMALVAGIACWIPARRAAKVNPIVALRCE